MVGPNTTEQRSAVPAAAQQHLLFGTNALPKLKRVLCGVRQRCEQARRLAQTRRQEIEIYDDALRRNRKNVRRYRFLLFKKQSLEAWLCANETTDKYLEFRRNTSPAHTYLVVERRIHAAAASLMTSRQPDAIEENIIGQKRIASDSIDVDQNQHKISSSKRIKSTNGESHSITQEAVKISRETDVVSDDDDGDDNEEDDGDGSSIMDDDDDNDDDGDDVADDGGENNNNNDEDNSICLDRPETDKKSSSSTTTMISGATVTDVVDNVASHIVRRLPAHVLDFDIFDLQPECEWYGTACELLMEFDGTIPTPEWKEKFQRLRKAAICCAKDNGLFQKEAGTPVYEDVYYCRTCFIPLYSTSNTNMVCSLCGCSEESIDNSLALSTEVESNAPYVRQTHAKGQVAKFLFKPIPPDVEAMAQPRLRRALRLHCYRFSKRATHSLIKQSWSSEGLQECKKYTQPFLNCQTVTYTQLRICFMCVCACIA